MAWRWARGAKVSRKVDKAPVTANDVTVYVHGRQGVCTVLNVEKEVAQIQGE